MIIIEAESIDGNKLVNGRERYVIVDARGLIWGVVFNATDIRDGPIAHFLVEHSLGY